MGLLFVYELLNFIDNFIRFVMGLKQNKAFNLLGYNNG